MSYINTVGKTILPMIRMARKVECIKDTYTLHLYGFNEYRGTRGIWKKVRMALKAKDNGGSN